MNSSRRTFLSGLSKLAGGAALGYIALPVLTTAIAGCEPTSVPLEPEQATTPIGPDGTVSVNVSALSQASPAMCQLSIIGADGYPVMVTLTSDGTVHAFSMRCTHQGCTVDCALVPTPSSGQVIYCGCHGSEFSLDGQVVLGPATQPLLAYPVTYNAASQTATIKVE